MNNMSKFQIATKSGHRATEHVFVIFSLMSKYEREGKSILIMMYDLRKFFDSESLLDCCTEMHKNQIRGKLYRLIFKLNIKERIRVKTPVGLTDSSETDPLVAQGSSNAAIISAVSLDNGVKESFHSKENDDEETEDDKDKIKKEKN